MHVVTLILMHFIVIWTLCIVIFFSLKFACMNSTANSPPPPPVIIAFVSAIKRAAISVPHVAGSSPLTSW